VLSGRGLCDGLINRPENPTDCDESLYVILKPQELGSWPTLGRNATGGGDISIVYVQHIETQGTN